MVKASELRIGNRLLFNDEIAEIKGYIKEDNSLGSVIVYVASEPIPNYSRKPVGLKALFGIPLVPEWFVKLGFHKFEQVIGIYEDELQYSFRNHKLELTFTVAYVVDRTGADVTRIRIRIDGDVLFVPKAIIHLHQLQNLYHALTGDELTIKK